MSQLDQLVGAILLTFFITSLFVPATAAQRSTEEIVTISDARGATRTLVPTADDDGDGIENGLEINGFTYDPANGIQPWNGDPSVSHFITDPLRWSTDGDPYSDYMETTGVNMPAAVHLPYAHPNVAARPVISMYLDSYDVIPISTITDTEGNELSESYTNETSNENQLGVSVKTEASLNPFNLSSVSVEVSYSHTWVHTESTTNASSINWSTSQTSDPSRAAKLKLKTYMLNRGSASALDVTPTFNLLIGGETIATITSAETANILTPSGTSTNRYPTAGAMIIDRDDDGFEITLSLEELKTLEAGAPLSLVVTQIDGKVVQWNEQTQDYSSEKDWVTYESEIDEVTMTVAADLGDRERYRYQVYAGTEFYHPDFRLGDLLALVLDVENVGGETLIQGRKYPDAWCLSTPSEALLTAWEQAGRPANMLGLPVSQRTILTMASPSSTPQPLVDLAWQSPDLREIVVSAEPEGGFPIVSVVANITVGYAEQSVRMTRQFGRPIYSTGRLPAPSAATGEVVVTDAFGATARIPVHVTARLVPSCEEYAWLRWPVATDRPNPGAEAIVFINGDPLQPAEVYCEYWAEKGTLLLPEAWTSFWIPGKTDVSDFTLRMHDGLLIDGLRGIVVGDAGTILRTVDEARTWSTVPIPVDTRLNSVDFSNTVDGMIVGAEGLVLTTDDGGESWRREAAGLSTELTSVTHVANDSWIVAGTDGPSNLALYRSSDMGKTWIRVSGGPGLIRRVVFRDSLVGVAVASGGLVLHTVDGGETWNPIRAADPTIDITDVNHTSGSRWVAVSTGGVLESLDDGLSWSLISTAELTEAEFASDLQGFGMRGYIYFYETTDGGVTWESIDGPDYAIRLRFYDRNRGIAVGDWESVYVTSSASGSPVVVTGVELPVHDRPTLASLESNYPNPFGRSTIIGFALSRGTRVRLSVFDLLGREIATLVDGVLPEGTHKVELAKDIPAGVYLYRLQTDGESLTRAMVHIR